jgi:hypothetical protein
MADPRVASLLPTGTQIGNLRKIGRGMWRSTIIT